jgi:hypothetical protein
MTTKKGTTKGRGGKKGDMVVEHKDLSQGKK